MVPRPARQSRGIVFPNPGDREFKFPMDVRLGLCEDATPLMAQPPNISPCFQTDRLFRIKVSWNYVDIGDVEANSRCYGERCPQEMVGLNAKIEGPC
jgi:hypothetical protein